MRAVVVHSVMISASAMLLLACGSGFNFVKRPTPSAIAGAPKLTIAPVTYAGLHVGNKTYEQYIADKAAKDDKETTDNWEQLREKWASDMQGILATELASAVPAEQGTAAEGLVVHVNVDAIEPGYYAFVSERPSVTQIRVKVYDAAKPDEVIYELTGMASSGGTTLDSRVSKDLENLANRLANFLEGEVKGS